MILHIRGRGISKGRGSGELLVSPAPISFLSGVDPELFQTAYDTFRAGTICERATLETRRVPARWTCTACGREIPRGEVLTCPSCQLPARLAPGGDEILLETIEMEVP